MARYVIELSGTGVSDPSAFQVMLAFCREFYGENVAGHCMGYPDGMGGGVVEHPRLGVTVTRES